MSWQHVEPHHHSSSMVASPRFTMRGKKTKGKTRRDALSSLGSMMGRKTALRASWTTPEHATYTSYPRHWHSLDWTPCNVDDERCHYSRHSSSLAFSIYEHVAPRRCLDFWGGEGGGATCDGTQKHAHCTMHGVAPLPSHPFRRRLLLLLLRRLLRKLADSSSRGAGY